MSKPPPEGSFVVPASYRAYRAVIVVLFLAILLVVGLGASGRGPVHALQEPTSIGITWVKKTTGVETAPKTAVKNKHPTRAGKHKKRHEKRLERRQKKHGKAHG